MGFLLRIRRKLVALQPLTDFEKRVLLEISNTKVGETLTYAELAYKLGNRKKARAVGNALAKNLFPIIIPCHRVVLSNGIGGYKLGRAAKRFLLFIERYMCKLRNRM
ncbi:MAG: methylated-DNA--[protein]-cysteine S-methyltransferase [Candidatus Micrarchaeia archaeon]